MRAWSVRPPDGVPPLPPAPGPPQARAPSGWGRGWAVVAFAAGVALLAAEGRGLWFVTDEWGLLLDRRTLDAAALLAPHNEHWVTGTTLLYRPLFLAVGFGDHLPYHLAGVALHAAGVGGTWALLRRLAVPRPVAWLAALALLLPATAPEQVFPPLALSWTPSLLLGFAAAAVLRRPPHEAPRALRGALPEVLAALLLLLAQPFGGVGLAAALGLGAALALQRRWRTALAVAGPAVVAYATWRATAGAATATRVEPAALVAVPAYIVLGLRAAVARLSGLPTPWADAVLAVAAIGVAVAAVRRRLDLLGLAGACSAIAFLALAGLARVEAGGVASAGVDRYLHLVGTWFLLAVAAAVPRRAWRASVQSLASVALIGILALGATGAHRAFDLRREATAAVEVRLVAADRLLAGGLPAVADAQPAPQLAPDVTAARLSQLRAEGVRLGRRGLTVDPTARASAALQLQLAFTRDRAPSARVVVTDADGPLAPGAPGCVRVALPPGGAVELDAVPGALRLLPPGGGLSATRVEDPEAVAARTESGRALALEVAIPTAVRLVSEDGGDVVICGLPAP